MKWALIDEDVEAGIVSEGNPTAEPYPRSHAEGTAGIKSAVPREATTARSDSDRTAAVTGRRGATLRENRQRQRHNQGRENHCPPHKQIIGLLRTRWGKRKRGWRATACHPGNQEEVTYPAAA